jgi:phage shock protein PspC (stress-responsive transcriptional regulator)
MSKVEKTLYRVPERGIIAGVAAGLAEYFDLDVTLVRLIIVLLAFISNGGVILIYVILAIIIPAKANLKPTSKTKPSLHDNVQKLSSELQDSGRIHKLRNWAGLGLIILGVWLLLNTIIPGWFRPRWDYIWPLVIISIGVLVVFSARGDKP